MDPTAKWSVRRRNRKPHPTRHIYQRRRSPNGEKKRKRKETGVVQATSPAPCIIQHLTCLNRFLLPLLFSTLLPSALLFLLPFSLTFHWLKSYGWYGQRALKWNVRKSSFSKIYFFFSSVHQLATVLPFFSVAKSARYFRRSDYADGHDA